jgi:hypothetical protein
LAGQAEPGPLLAAVTPALREIIHCSKTYVALFAEAEGLEHIHFHVVPRTDHPDPAFCGPFVFALRGGDTATQVPGQVRNQITANSPRLRAYACCPPLWDEEGQPLAPPKARRAAAWRATSGMESKAVRHPRKPSVPQISRFCMRTLATTAAICRGQNGYFAWSSASRRQLAGIGRMAGGLIKPELQACGPSRRYAWGVRLEDCGVLRSGARFGGVMTAG